MMSVSTFLEHCEKLTYAERKKYVVDYGRRSKTNVEPLESVETLFSGPLYQKVLALDTCYGSRSVSFALRALSVHSKLLREHAIVVILQLGADFEILKAIDALPLHLQIHTIRRLRTLRRRRRRPQVIDEFLEALRQDPEKSKIFRELLPYGSRNLVDRHLPDVIDQLSRIDWYHLAKFQPEVTKEAIHAGARRCTVEDPRLVTLANQTITLWAASEETSDIALDVIKVMQASTSLDKLSLEKIVRRRPQQIIDLILATEEKVQTALELDTETLRKLSVQHIVALQKRYNKAVIQNDFPYLKAEQRAIVFPLVRDAWSSYDGVISVDIVKLLPSELRISEARRHVKHRIYDENPSNRIPYISLLPWEEALELQTPFLKSKEADIRSLAIQWQLESVKYDDSYVPDALQLAIKRQYEQSPVRDAMWKGLSEIPASRWKESHFLDIEKIIRHALDASDLSAASLHKMQSILGGIVAFHPRWASSQMALIIRERGWNTMTSEARFAGVIPVKKSMDILNAEMSPLFEILLKLKDPDALVQLARRYSFYGANCAREWTGLLDTLEKFLALYDTNQIVEFAHPAYTILQVLRKERPTTWWRNIPNWVNKKSYLMKQTAVFEHIHSHMQNLLLPYLGKDFVFCSNINPLNSLRNGFERWNPSQQETFASRLIEDIQDDKVTAYEKQNQIKQLGLLSFIDPSHLINLASDKTPIIQEAALKALGRLDSDAGMPTLIEGLTDERARTAIYALRTTFLSMSKNESLRMLQSVPMTKVTVAKEVVRLIGDLRTGDAFQTLLEIEQTKLHADVRIALFRALWSYLSREETWKLFTRAAQDPDIDTAKAVLDIPQDGMSSDVRQSFLRVLLLLLDHPSVEVRIAALKKFSDLQLQDPDNQFVPRLLELLQSHSKTELESAADVFFKTYSRAQPELIGNVFKEALKDRRTVSSLHVVYLRNVSPSNFRYMDTTTHHILSIFTADRLLGSLSLKIIFGGLPFSDVRRLLLELIPRLHADNLGLSESLIRANVEIWDGSAAEEFEQELAVGKDERARRLALEFLTASVRNGGSWTDEKRKRLDGYRQDDSILVAEAAWEVDLPENEA